MLLVLRASFESEQGTLENRFWGGQQQGRSPTDQQNNREYTHNGRTTMHTQRLILGACLLVGRTVAFHVPIGSSLSRHARPTQASNLPSGRRVHAGRVVMAAATGEMQGTIEGRLTEALSPVHLEVINESDKHAGPAKESHFKVRKQGVLTEQHCKKFGIMLHTL